MASCIEPLAVPLQEPTHTESKSERMSQCVNEGSKLKEQNPHVSFFFCFGTFLDAGSHYMLTKQPTQKNKILSTCASAASKAGEQDVTELRCSCQTEQRLQYESTERYCMSRRWCQRRRQE
jgi:hypothetical protein